MEIEEAHLPFRPVRLLLVADSLDVGGAERHVVDLASALARQGHSVTLACSIQGALAPLAEQAGVRVQALLRRLIKRRKSPRYTWELARLVRRECFDLVHAHMFSSALASAEALAGTETPLVITEHSQAAWRSPYACRCSQWAYSRAKHIIAVSREIKWRLVEQDGVPYDRVSVIMNAVSPAPLQALIKAPDIPGVSEASALVGVVTRLQPEKGVAYFIEAAAAILQRLPRVHFLIVGDGPRRRALQMYAEQLGIQKQVHFLGFRLDARAIVASLDVLVVPSLSEGTPLVTLEAMAAGVPVVASSVGGIPEQVKHEGEGLLVPPGNALALGEAILRLLANPSWARMLGQAGRQRVAAQFRLETMVKQTEDLYRALLGWPAGAASESEALDGPLTQTGR